MSTMRITVTVDRGLLARLDRLVRQGRFVSRSQAVQAAIEKQLARLEKNRLVRECAKLDPLAEQRLAEEGMSFAADYS